MISPYTILPTDSPQKRDLRERLRKADLRSAQMHQRACLEDNPIKHRVYKTTYRLLQLRGNRLNSAVHKK